MAYRVVQWGTGNVGTHALRAIIERPTLELVGLFVYNPDKAGADAGALAGMDAIGVAATTSREEIYGLDADCVNYNALGETMEGVEQTVTDICELLRRGFNVTSSAIEHLVYPRSAPHEMLTRLEKACEEGGSTFFATGINPGFTMDVLPIVLSRVVRRIDRMRSIEVLSMRTYSSASAMAFMGFGREADTPSPMDPMHTDPEKSSFHSSMLMIADAVGFELDGWRYLREVGVAEHPVDTAFGRIERGKVAVVRVVCVGCAYGRDVLQHEWVWRVTDDVRPEWGTGAFWEVTVEGDPTLTSRVEGHTSSGRIVSLHVASSTVNAIPTVVQASPGVKSPLDLPLFGGGYVPPIPPS